MTPKQITGVVMGIVCSLLMGAIAILSIIEQTFSYTPVIIMCVIAIIFAHKAIKGDL